MTKLNISLKFITTFGKTLELLLKHPYNRATLALTLRCILPVALNFFETSLKPFHTGRIFKAYLRFC